MCQVEYSGGHLHSQCTIIVTFCSTEKHSNADAAMRHLPLPVIPLKPPVPAEVVLLM